MHTLVTTLALAATLMPASALACGGFFCSNTPIDQAGENIVFGVDRELGLIETHVQITYEGRAEDFAWVVPVPTVPELFLSTETLFTELAASTTPRFDLRYDYGRCGRRDPDGSSTADTDSWSGTATGTGTGGGYTSGVSVVYEQQVGPYDSVVLSATSSEALVVWLEDNGYDLPDGIEPVLAPYVADSAFFVALKLANDRTAGDIEPLGMRYTGDRPMIPIQLTSIAATPDMRLRVWVFGDARAVPDNYLHVRINPLQVDWYDPSNYAEVVSLAADEAGGQAFATDYAGPPTGGLPIARFDTAALAELDDPEAFVNAMMAQGFPANDTLLSLLQFHLPPPAGVEPTAYYNCLWCYADRIDLSNWTPVGMANKLEKLFVQPMTEADRLFDHAWLTSLTSSVSPVEMTIDPRFAFNPDMGEVGAQRAATLHHDCKNRKTYYGDAPRRFVLDDLEIPVPAESTLDDLGLSLPDYLASLSGDAALIIEETGASGQPSILVDNTRALLDAADRTYADTEGTGCGCTSAPGLGGWLAAPLALGALMLRRRRDG